MVVKRERSRAVPNLAIAIHACGWLVSETGYHRCFALNTPAKWFRQITTAVQRPLLYFETLRDETLGSTHDLSAQTYDANGIFEHRPLGRRKKFMSMSRCDKVITGQYFMHHVVTNRQYCMHPSHRHGRSLVKLFFCQCQHVSVIFHLRWPRVMSLHLNPNGPDFFISKD